MNTLVWLFFGMTVIITAFVTNWINSFFNKRKVRNAVKKYHTFLGIETGDLKLNEFLNSLNKK